MGIRVMRCAALIALLVAAAPRLNGAPPPTFGKLRIPRVSSPPPIEAYLEMAPSPAWAGRLAQVERFVQRVPHDGEAVSQPTQAYLGYDDKNLYAIFICEDREPEKVRARLSRREDIWDDDTVELMLDTFYDHRRAYAFFSNPLGVQGDGIWTEGQDWDFSFDTVFDTQARRTSQGFVVRMAIPFRSLRFASSDPQTWGILLNRDIKRNNESSFWPQYSSRIAGRLNQEAEASGLENISPGRNLQLIPYGIFRSFREPDLRDPFHPTYSQSAAHGQVGLDGKVVLKDKFVLDATVNPDFSQIESDDPQVTVNQRFEVLFPEKRPFFLENASYFNTPINLLFTRRIADPKWGVRLTGKDGPWAVGALVADDSSPGERVPLNDPLAGQKAHFAIARVNRDIGSQSTIGLMYTDREMGRYYNRVGGMDGHFKLNSHWTADAQYVLSSTYDLTDSTTNTGEYLAGPAAEVLLQRQGLGFNYLADYSDRSDGFRTLTGFDPQPDIRNIYQRAQYVFHVEGRKLISWTPTMEVYQNWDHAGNHLGSGFFPSVKFEFPGQTIFEVVAYGKEMELLRPKDFSVLSQNQKYERYTNIFRFDTSYYRPVTLHLEYRQGQRINYDPPAGVIPFLAARNFLLGTLTVRPNKSLRVDNTYILFRLHDLHHATGGMNNHIFRSKWNYQFTKELSLRFVGQYNTVLANPGFTSLPTTKNFNADILATYLVHPNTAIYVGYNSNLENVLSPLAADLDGNLERGPRLVNNGRNFFVKASYLFRF